MTPDERADRIDPIIAEFARLRVDRGWSRQELGRRAGISGRAIICLEAGRNGATLHTVRALAAVFGLEVEVRRLRAHGTAAARARHRYRREPLCVDCKRWDRERKRNKRQLSSQPVDSGYPQVCTTSSTVTLDSADQQDAA